MIKKKEKTESSYRLLLYTAARSAENHNGSFVILHKLCTPWNGECTSQTLKKKSYRKLLLRGEEGKKLKMMKTPLMEPEI